MFLPVKREKEPAPGDLLVCKYCGTVVRLTEQYEARILTDGEEIAMENSMREELTALQWAVRSPETKYGRGRR